MKRFKNILLVYECDPSTLERVATLAKDNRARLTIVQVVKDLPGYRDRLNVSGKPIDVRKLVLREYESRLKVVAKSVNSMGVRPKTELLVGEPFMEIIRDVIKNRRDLVVISAEGKEGLREQLFGSTSTFLLRKCPAPVLVLKPSRQRRFQKILAAIDPEVTGDAHDTLNHTILELAASMAERESAELHVVHAWTFPGESVLRAQGTMFAKEVDRLIFQGADKRAQLVANLLAANSVQGHQTHLLKGDAYTVVSKLVSKLGIDLLVMGTVCRTGIPGFIIGNTAERVLNAVSCSVLAIKPDGFVSPVAPQVASTRS